MLEAKAGAPVIRSFHYFMKQHVSEINFRAMTKVQYCESAAIVRLGFIFILQTLNAFLNIDTLIVC